MKTVYRNKALALANKKSKNNTDKLVRRLANHESIIEKLFATSNSALILEKKISQLEEMCAEFPGDSFRTADQWRNKVVDLWQRFAILAGSAGSNSSAISISNKPQSQSLEPNAVTISKSPILKKAPISIISSSKPALLSNPRPGLLKTPPSSPLISFTSLGCKSTDPMPNTPEKKYGRCPPKDIAKKALRDQLEKTFGQMGDIQSGADVDAVKSLLSEVAKAQQQISNFTSDCQLQEMQLELNVFNFAFHKLSSKMREQFLAIYGSHQFGINLKNLISFLQAEIVAQHTKTVWLLSMQAAANKKASNVASTSKKSSTPFDRMKVNFSTGNYCKYCKTVGHIPASCHLIKSQLCFQCYQYGHTKKVCTNKPLV